jgi:CBS domain-containing protein
MASDPVSIQANQTVKEAAEMVAENEFHALPVLEGNNLVGIISTTDIIRYLIEAIEESSED